MAPEEVRRQRPRHAAKLRAARGALWPPEQQRLVLALRSVLCDPTRAKIILALRTGELSVGDLAEVLGRSESATSQHLRVLRDRGVVRSRRRGRAVFYTLGDVPVARVAETILGTVSQWQPEA